MASAQQEDKQYVKKHNVFGKQLRVCDMMILK